MADEADQPNQELRSGELAALSTRVTALESEIARLRILLGRTAARPEVEVRGDELPLAVLPPPIPAPVRMGAGTRSKTPDNAAEAGGRSFETRLGSQIFSRVAIVALLIGAALFLKWAVDNQWIGPAGRVLAGLSAGAGLVVWSERFRRKGFGAFSYSLKAVGSGVLYLSLWAAFQLYHLLPAGAALGAMLLVTAWNAYMAWVQNAELLAAYALIGGCATPLLLSTGGNQEGFLFSYLLAIDVATVALVRLRRWPRLLLGVFPATMVYFIGWYVEHYSTADLALTATFVALFFLTFASVPLWIGDKATADGVVKRRSASVITDVLLPLAAAGFGSLAFYSMLQDAGRHDLLPWMVLVFAAIYLGLMRLPQSAAAKAVHLSLAIVFLTIAIPLKASGRWITVSWLVEGTALLWVASRLGGAADLRGDSPAEAVRMLRTLAVSALLLGLASLLLDMRWFDAGISTPFVNRRFATVLVGIAAFCLSAWIALHARIEAEKSPGLSDSQHSLARERHFWLQIGGGSIIAANLVAILGTVREIMALWNMSGSNPEAELQQALAISAFLMVYGAVLLAAGFWKRSAFIRWQALLLIIYSIAKTFLYDLRNLSQGYRVASFMALGVLLLAVSFAYQNDWLALRNKADSADVRGEEHS